MIIIKITPDETVNLALDTIQKNKQALIFVGSKKSAEKQAEEIAKKCKTQQEELAEKALHALAKPTEQCERLAKCIEKGIAFHHAGLHSKQRELIENHFRSGEIKIICSTPTLAAGLDLPAFRTIIKDVKRYAGKFGMQYIPVLEYLQMAGRAGRPKYDTEGQAICIAKSESEKEELWIRYIEGQPEEIYSKLAVEPVLRTYLLSLIATKVVNTKQEILAFFQETFWAMQYKDMYKLEQIIDRMLHLLVEWDFLKSAKQSKDFVSAHDLKNETYTSTPLGTRVAELYLDPLTAYKLVKAIQKTKKTAHPFALLHLISNTLEMRPLLRTKTREIELIQKEALKYESYLLEKEPSLYDPEYEDFLDSLKTALMLHAWIEEKEEQYLLETYDTRPGETRAKIEIGDWLLYTLSELAKIVEQKELMKEIAKLRIRLKNGVKEELLLLLKLEGIGRVRSRKMFDNRIRTITDVKNADPAILAQLIGKKIAIDIKKQVGEEIDETKILVSEHKRTGQMSLKKY